MFFQSQLPLCCLWCSTTWRMTRTSTWPMTPTFQLVSKPVMPWATLSIALEYPCFAGCLSCASIFSGHLGERHFLDMVFMYLHYNKHFDSFGSTNYWLLLCKYWESFLINSTLLGQRGSPRFFAYLAFGVGAPIFMTLVRKNIVLNTKINDCFSKEASEADP